MTSAGEAALDLQTDGAILASGMNIDADVYTLTFNRQPTPLAAIRLEVLADPSLPGNGPGRHPSGNFQLAEISVHTVKAGGDLAESPVTITAATDSYHWTGEVIEHVLDNDPNTIWHVWGRLGQNHSATFQFERPIISDPDDQLVIRLTHSSREPGINLGRFRLSATDTESAVELSKVSSQ